MAEEQDLKFGEIAIGKKLLSLSQVQECQKAAAVAAEAGIPISLHEVAVKKGYLQQSQADAILRQVKAAETGQKAATRIGNYELIAKVGEGGMGAVYKAKQLGMDRLVALKILPLRLAKNKTFIERFYREGRSVGKLNHVNIVTAYEVGEADGYHFLAMEFVDGETLSKLLKREGKLSEERALEITIQIARAVGFAWQEAKMVHRDIKPDNILLTSKGIAKLADLGLAKETGADVTAMTQSGMALGTPHYISPEQARGEKDVDTRSDIYSLGATLYHMVAGKTPFQGSSVGVVMAKHLTEELPDPKDLNPSLSEGICQVIGKMMAKEPNARYLDGQELVRDLELVIDGKEPACGAVGSMKLGSARGGVRQQTHSKKQSAGPPIMAPAGPAPADKEEDRPPAHGRHGKRASATKSKTPVIAGAVIVVAVVAGVAAFFFFGGGSGNPQAALPASKTLPAGPTASERKPGPSAEAVSKEESASKKKRDQASAEQEPLKKEEEQKSQEAKKAAGQDSEAEKARLAKEAEDKKSLQKLAAIRCEVEETVPELMGEAAEPTGLRAIVDARKKLEIVKSWGIESASNAIASDLEKLKELEAQAAVRETGAFARKSRKTTDEAATYLKKADFEQAQKKVQEAVAGLRASAEGLDKDTGRPLQDELVRCEAMLSDIRLLAEIRELGLTHCEDLVGSSILIGTVMATVDKVEGGKVIAKSGDVSFAQTLTKLPLETLSQIGLKHEPDKKRQSSARFLLAFYQGNIPLAKSTLQSARQAVLDTSRYETMVTEVESRKEDTAKVAAVIARLETAFADKDKSAATDILTELESLIPGDPRMAGFSQKVAGLPRFRKTFAVKLGGGVTMEFVLIQPGTFAMGSEKGGTTEKPVHRVKISKPFYLGRYEVTQEQWQSVMGNNPSQFKGPTNPVEQVSWEDCQRFLKELREKAPGRQFSLPTEAQWEYACRAGSTGDYCFGNKQADCGEYAWYDHNAERETHPVGTRKPNAWGLYDMHGNVWEWCVDWQGEYPKSPVSDPTGSETGSSRVVRGGSWRGNAGDCRSADRFCNAPWYRDYASGFRVVCGVDSSR